MAVEITIRRGLDSALTGPLRGRLRRTLNRAMRLMGHQRTTLSVLVTADEEMRSLNRRWRGIDRTTDVLSFQGGGDVLGDVAISLEQAARQAKHHGVPLDEEVGRLLIHGLLHLLGHDHRTPAQRRAMNAMTERILKKVL